MSEEDPHKPEALDAARAILNRMRESAISRGEARIDAAKAAKFEENAAARKARRRDSSAPPKYSDGRDPQEIGNLFGKIVRDRGWSAPVAVGSVLSRWNELVGPQIAEHCSPESFEDSTVVVRCDSTTWATQIRLLSHELLKHFDRELGQGVITVIRVLGPSAPSWRHGGRSVKGRGPRDTYG
ncbi:RNA-binding protein [Arthrobacter sp. MYb227]|uniref:DUF721 domain-containing protein n=1 Tax=Arthrobacter sp. MYb227 TaxID=1848601 RepID=UPI000CFCE7EB|nr:DciA family protein [Arthrobacter sp. MYb227]PQZ90266.1 RNA-binding protein [Arthrobacter sp. MYb227]